MIRRRILTLISFLLAILLITTVFVSNFRAFTTETPTEAPAIVPTETHRPESVKVSIKYDYGFVPVNWIQNHKTNESVTFYVRESGWSEAQLSPVALYKGPLFPVTVDQPHSTGCPFTNTILTDQNQNQIIYIRANCSNLGSEETAKIDLRLGNCTRDYRLTLTCTYQGLTYKLNSEQNKFEFQFSGVWSLQYDGAINDSLTLLGFTAPDDSFYRGLVENQIYTIDK